MASPSKQPRGQRSKDGCLTCRDRHVKCDENKPTCLRCTRGSLRCKWGGQRISLPDRKKREIWEAKNKPLKRLEAKIACHDWDLLGPLAAQFSDLLDFPLLDLDLDGGMGPTMLPHPSPLIGLQLDSTWQLADLPSLTPLTEAEREALDYYQKEATFGYGSKDPTWSSHAIIWRTARESPALLHLLLAAAQAEKGWRHGSHHPLLDSAENNYQLGRQSLEREIGAVDVDPVLVMAAFWFLFLHQRRRRLIGQRILYQELSVLMTDFFRTHRLHQILVSPSSKDSALPVGRKALAATLMVWLFWADAQYCFLGEGGSMAKLLVGPDSPRAIFDLYDVSRETLRLNWAPYPYDQQVDDIKNSGALELIHHTWVLVQELTDAVEETGQLDPETSVVLGFKIDALRQRTTIRAVMQLTESDDAVRDRLLLNSEWAAACYYALHIYHFRCSLASEDEPFASASPGTAHIEELVSTLLMLVQKSLAAENEGQVNRLQWALFWAGVETTDAFKQRWILSKLKNEGFHEALGHVLSAQAAGVRISMAEIRQTCKASCAGMPDAGLGRWGS